MSSSSSSSSSGIFQTENRATTQISRLKQEYDRRLLHYEKEFDVSLSRMVNRERGLKESMLAYTERMRKITNTKHSMDGMLAQESSPLYVRAKHIPKFPVTKNKTRRPASFDELIGKNANSNSNKPRREKPKSASRLSLPLLPDRYKKNSHNVKISFVSASDLYDIVDFSIRNKGNKEETLRYLGMESSNSQSSPSPTDRPAAGGGNRKTSRNGSKLASLSPTPQNNKGFGALPTLPPIESAEKDSNDEADNSDTDSDSLDLNKASVEAFKRSPNRAKRMQINKPGLDDIPENDVTSQKRSAKSDRTLPSPPPKQSPRNVINMQSHLMSIPEHDASGDELMAPDRKRMGRLSRREIGGQNSIRLEPFSVSERSTVKEQEETDQHLKMKLKAQKRFKKLIFLRDVPERHHRF